MLPCKIWTRELGEGATNDQMRSFYSTDKNIHEAIFSASVFCFVVII